MGWDGEELVKCISTLLFSYISPRACTYVSVVESWSLDGRGNVKIREATYHNLIHLALLDPAVSFSTCKPIATLGSNIPTTSSTNSKQPNELTEAIHIRGSRAIPLGLGTKPATLAAPAYLRM